MWCKCSPHLVLAHFTCKVAAHSPDDHLSQWDWKEVCPESPSWHQPEHLRCAGSRLLLHHFVLFCAAFKGLARVENWTSALHQHSQLLIFTQVPMATKKQKMGQQRTSEKQTYWLIVPINKMFTSTFSSHLSYLLALLPLGKITW